MPAFFLCRQGKTFLMLVTKDGLTGSPGIGPGIRKPHRDGRMLDTRRHLMQQLKNLPAFVRIENIRRHIDLKENRLPKAFKQLPKCRRPGNMRRTAFGQAIILATRLPASFCQAIVHYYIRRPNNSRPSRPQPPGTFNQHTQFIHF